MARKYITCHRRGTKQQWEDHSMIIPREGEIVIEIDDDNHYHKLKIGDGIHKYSELAYLMAGDEIVTQVLVQALPRVATITLTDAWNSVTDEENSFLGYYSQVINMGDCPITKYSRVDLQPDANMLAEFKSLDLAFVAENDNETITVYSVGAKPEKAYTMQATIIETDGVGDYDKVLGIPVGTPTSMAELDTDLRKYVNDTKAELIGKNTDPTTANTIQANKNYTLNLFNMMWSRLGGGVSDLEAETINIKTLSERLATLETQYSTTVTKHDTDITSLKTLTNHIQNRSVLVDINFANKTIVDSKGRLTFANNNQSVTPSYASASKMNSYGATKAALKLSSVDNYLKYKGEVILRSQFSIELYGVFKNGEIFNDANYNIEVSSANGKFGTWYHPNGGNPYVCSSQSYDLSKAHHIMLVGDVDTYLIYVDGILADAKSLTIKGHTDLCANYVGDITNDFLIIGGSSSTSHLMRFRVFDVALHGEDVAAIYNSYNPL